MGERPGEIELEIRQARAELGANLRDLEDKVREVTDCRQHFRRHTLLILGLAFGSGLLLSATLPRRELR